jgi:hypothetical protein
MPRIGVVEAPGLVGLWIILQLQVDLGILSPSHQRGCARLTSDPLPFPDKHIDSTVIHRLSLVPSFKTPLNLPEPS